MQKELTNLRTFFKGGASLICLGTLATTSMAETHPQMNQDMDILPPAVQQNYDAATNSLLGTIQTGFHQAGDFILNNGTQVADFIQESGRGNTLSHLTNPISKMVQGGTDIGTLITTGTGDVIKRTEPMFKLPFHLIESCCQINESYESKKVFINHIQNDLMSTLLFCMGEGVKTTIYSGFRAAHLACDVGSDIFNTIRQIGNIISPETVQATEKEIETTQKLFNPNNQPFLPQIQIQPQKTPSIKQPKQSEARKTYAPEPFPKPKKLYAYQFSLMHPNKSGKTRC